MKERKGERKCNQNQIMMIEIYIIKISIEVENITAILKSTVNNKQELSSDHNDGLIINDQKQNKYDKYRIDDIKD